MENAIPHLELNLDTFQTIRERRSIKHYDPSHVMPVEDEQLLIDLALEAPSSFNVQHWRLVNVKNPEIRAQLRVAAFDQEQVTDASLLFVVCADVKAWEKEPERYWRNAPINVQNTLLPMMHAFYNGKEQLQRDEAIRSTSFLAQNMMLTAKAMGYDSCSLIGFDPDEVSRIIDLPSDHLVSILLTIGKGTVKPWPKPGHIDQSKLVLIDGFSKKSPSLGDAETKQTVNGAGFWNSI